MENFRRHIFIGIVFLILNSCRFLDAEGYLIANSAWFMDTIESNGKDVKYLFTSNLLIFTEESCDVPYLQTQFEKGINVGTWQVDDENHTVTITSKNPYFNGTFEFCFEDHKKDNVVELYMVSDSISILAHSPNKMESGLLELPFSCADE